MSAPFSQDTPIGIQVYRFRFVNLNGHADRLFTFVSRKENFRFWRLFRLRRKLLSSSLLILDVALSAPAPYGTMVTIVSAVLFYFLYEFNSLIGKNNKKLLLLLMMFSLL